MATHTGQEGPTLPTAYQAHDWNALQRNGRYPFRVLEPIEREIAVVDDALTVLRDGGVLVHTSYDHAKMLAHRQAVAERFDIPWTSVSLRMQRLLYAINAISQPANLIAAGVFCGNTFISNAGAAVGPGASYAAARLIGVEIIPDEAERAERNVRRIDPTGVARVVAADAVGFVRGFPGRIDLLYLDADNREQGKGIYLDILQSAIDKMPPGSIVLAHDSLLFEEQLKHYLAFVRDPANMRASVSVILDVEGLEVSIR